MGMDLKPINPSEFAPKDENGSPVWGRYNWAGWNILRNKLIEWKVDTSELKSMNDGEVISERTCLAIADAIEKHAHELDKDQSGWLAGHIIRWRTCGGYEQW